VGERRRLLKIVALVAVAIALAIAAGVAAGLGVVLQSGGLPS
jgi:hypothetical protein